LNVPRFTQGGGGVEREKCGCRAGRCRGMPLEGITPAGGECVRSGASSVRASPPGPPVIRRSSGRLRRATHPGCECSVVRHTATVDRRQRIRCAESRDYGGPVEHRSRTLSRALAGERPSSLPQVDLVPVTGANLATPARLDSSTLIPSTSRRRRRRRRRYRRHRRRCRRCVG